LIKEFRVSMTRTKRSGDNGSSCRRPQAWEILLPGVPLRITLVLEVDSIKETQLTQRLEKLSSVSILSRNLQLTVSKALVISNFRRAQDTLCR